MNTSHPQSSILLNTNDPIQVHLLVETALGDSKDYEILSPEEVDDLKKQRQTLTQRITQTRQNLAIQSKYRDAAISMAKLYSPTGEKKQRRSLLGSRNSNTDSLKEADMERLASERKCEDLATELWTLEKRLMEPERRLLQHTAGILQMTHKGPAKVQKTNGVNHQGIPGSPESMYTYSNARSSMEPPSIEEDLFDERSLYRMFDRFDGQGTGPGGNASRDSWDNTSSARNQSDHIKTITDTEQKLRSLNNRLRDVIVKANPQRERSFSSPPSASQNETGATSGKLLASHLVYLEKGLNTIDEEHSRLNKENKESDMAIEETVEELNREVHDILSPFDSSRDGPPQLTGKSLPAQINYLQNSIGAFEHELQRASAASANSKEVAAQQDAFEQMETIMTGLWDLIQAGEQDVRKQKLERRQTRTVEEDSSGDDMLEASDESFSLQAFSSKVQRLFSQTNVLKDKQKILQRQIKQQRELNSKGEGEKDGQITQLTSDLENTQQELIQAKKEAKDLQAQLQQVMVHLDDARKESTQRGLEKARGEEDSAALQSLEFKLHESNEKIIVLEEELQDLKDDQGISNAEVQSRLAEAGARIETLTAQLAKSQVDEPRLKKLIDDNEELINSKEQEMEAANMEIARLQTEVTIARAELDGAYGSRAQRAAEVAANPVIQKELDDLTNHNEALEAEIAQLKRSGGNNESLVELKRELSETIEEYEIMTKASIEWEKEREQLEAEVDKLRDEREAMEQKLGDEQVRWLGMKSPGPGTQGEAVGAGSTSTTVLKNEFKKMMRDTRAENAKALRVCLSISS
jgi:hypothetical protein